MSEELKKGDEVSWNWGGGQPSGKVAEIKAEKAEVMSNKGNVISKNGTEDDPAVIIERPGNNVVKRAHELNEVES